MNMSSPLLQGEILEVIKSKSSIRFEDLFKEIKKIDPDVEEKDILRVLLKMEILGMVNVTRLSKKDFLIELIERDKAII